MTSLDRAVAYWSLGWLPSDELPRVAIEALENGIESPSILELASADSGAGPHLNTVFEKVLVELGRPRLTKREAGRLIAREYAEEICTGKTTPINGLHFLTFV